MSPAGAGAPAAPSGGAGGAPSTSSPGGAGSKLPCDVWQALARACHSCHGAVPANGAPMSLTAWEDFQRKTIVRPMPLIYEVARMRIDGSRLPLMPPNGTISAEDKKTLLDWLNGGAPAATSGNACK